MKPVRKWRSSKVTGPQYEKHFIAKSSEFKRYPSNMYILNRAALKIQHAFFRNRVTTQAPEPAKVAAVVKQPVTARLTADRPASARPVVNPSPAKRNRRTRQSRGGKSHMPSFVEPAPAKTISTARNPVSASFVSRPKTPSMKGPVKPTVAEREAERIARVKASRKAYSKRPSAARLKKGQPTVSEDELNKIVAQGWANAEKAKAKRKPATKKKAHVKSQDTLMEEAQLNTIVQTAWSSVGSKPAARGLKKPTKRPIKSQDTIAEEQELSSIVNNAWKNVEEGKVRPSPSPCKKKRAHVKSQNTLMEEAQLNQIVGKAWADVEERKAKAAASPAKKHKAHIKSQQTL